MLEVFKSFMDFSHSESICSELFLHVSSDLDQGQVLKDF